MPRAKDIITGVRICAKVSTIDPCPIVAAKTSKNSTIPGHFLNQANAASIKAGCPIKSSFERGRA